MEMFVYIDVIQRKTRACECRKLRTDLRFQLAAQLGLREETYAVDEHPAVHAAGLVGEIGDEVGSEYCTAVGEDEMQPDAQAREFARAANRVGGGRSPH